MTSLVQVAFSPDNKFIVAMKSMADEEISLSRHVEITDQVEVWLDSLAKEMKHTLKKVSIRHDSVRH